MRFSVLVDSCVLGAEETLLARGATEVCLCDAGELPGVLKHECFDGVVVRSGTPLDSSLLDGTDVRFAATATVGVDHVDEAYLAAQGIHFAHAAGSSARTVAEFTMAMAFVALARIGRTADEVKSIAVIGYGAIGSRVASGARAMGWRVLPVDPPLQRAGDNTMLPLREALNEADIVTLHVPLISDGDDRTQDLVNASFMEAVKPGSLLINTSRGSILNERVADAALQSQRLAGAALDVFENEPQPSTDILAHATVVTPHVAGRTQDGLWANTIAIGDELSKFLGCVSADAVRSRLPIPPEALVGDGSVVDLIEKTWGLKTIEDKLRKGGDGFRAARLLAQQRRDLSKCPLPSSTTQAQRQFHEILNSL